MVHNLLRHTFGFDEFNCVKTTFFVFTLKLFAAIGSFLIRNQLNRLGDHRLSEPTNEYLIPINAQRGVM